jgi:hypothetical protein
MFKDFFSFKFNIFNVKAKYPRGYPPSGVEVLWRAEFIRYSVILDAERDLYTISDPQLELRWYEIKNKTKCGVRLMNGRFVNLDKNKKWACLTPEDALISLHRRLKKQNKILVSQMDRNKEELEMVTHIINNRKY